MRNRIIIATLVLAVSSLGGPDPAAAAPLIPGPGAAGHDSALADKAEAYYRQIQGFLAVQLGWGLEAYIISAANRQLLDDFFAAKQTDFVAFSGKHPYEVIDAYGEFGDLGMFGGVQAAGDAFRYAVLRDGGAPSAEVDEARATLLRALDGLHWYTQVTGKPGIVARGLRRIVAESGDPPLPGTPPETVPLFDSQGNPQPAEKEITWRADQSGELPFLIWLDDCSKDQLDGYIFALGAFYDVIQGDASIPADRVSRLVEDARAIGIRLMERVDIGYTDLMDLVIQDADGRPTTFHDLSAEEIAPGIGWFTAINGFNGLLSLSIMRTLYHITGDQEIGRFYYQSLVGQRGYLDVVEQTLSLVYLGKSTNYSNVNMAFVAIYSLLRYESDPVIAQQVRSILEQQLYAPGLDRQAQGLQQSLFDFIFAGFRGEGIKGPGATALQDGMVTLEDFPDPPYWDEEVINCDAQEIAALQCSAVDGTQLTLFDLGDGKAVSEEPLPMRIRPPSNFTLRSDPHDINGGGGSRLNPGAGFHAAYWMGRFLEATEDGMQNLSPAARPPLPTNSPDDAGTDAVTDAGPADSGGDQGSGDDGGGDDGCGCEVADAPGEGLPELTLLLLLALVILARRPTAAGP
jgi:MYXO-CTERM domain-containing protein